MIFFQTVGLLIGGNQRESSWEGSIWSLFSTPLFMANSGYWGFWHIFMLIKGTLELTLCYLREYITRTTLTRTTFWSVHSSLLLSLGAITYLKRIAVAWFQLFFSFYWESISCCNICVIRFELAAWKFINIHAFNYSFDTSSRGPSFQLVAQGKIVENSFLSLIAIRFSLAGT